MRNWLIPQSCAAGACNGLCRRAGDRSDSGARLGECSITPSNNNNNLGTNLPSNTPGVRRRARKGAPASQTAPARGPNA